MKIIVHYPKTKENLFDLQKKTAVIHAEAVLQYIQKMPCSKEQKLELINDIIERFYNKEV